MNKRTVSSKSLVIPFAALSLLTTVLISPTNLRAEDQTQLVASIRQTWDSLHPRENSTGYRFLSRLSRANPGAELVLASERETTYRDSPVGFSFDNRNTTFENGKRNKHEREVLLVNKSYSCRLREDVTTGQFILIDRPILQTDGEGRARVSDALPFNRLHWLTPARTFKLIDLLDPSLVQIVKTEFPDPEHVRVTMRARSGLPEAEQQRLRGVTGGTLLLNRQWQYRLEYADLDFDPQTQHRQNFRCVYLDEPGREHFLKSMESDAKWQLKGDNSPRSGKQTWEFESLPPTDDPTIFYMSHFGLPEPEGISPPNRPVPLWVWLLIATVVFAVAAVVIRLVLRRRIRTIIQPVPPPVG